MFRKYEKTFRISSPSIQVAGKLNLTSGDQKSLLNGKVEISEKMDGANVGIVRSENNWTLQKRRGLAETGVHEQFAFFWNWARYNESRILQIPKNHIVYGELLYTKHNIHYTSLPSYFLVFDIWNGKEYLDYQDKNVLLEKLGFLSVPILHYGYVTISEVDRFIGKSAYADGLMEGIVIKNYHKQMRGKLVRKEFMKELDENDHWMHQAHKRNLLAEGASPYN